MASSTITPCAESIFKAQIFRCNGPIFNATRAHRNGASCSPLSAGQLVRVRLALLPRCLPAHPRSLQIRHRDFLPRPTLPSLLQFRPPPMGPAMSSVADSKTVRVVVKGMVQGVFYRNWTVENARELGLKGWVRNRRDGSVEALFSGSPDKVQEMERRCRSGPPAARVTGLDVFPCSDDPGTGFERIPTA